MKSIPLSLKVIIVVFLSRIAWYDLRTIDAYRGAETNITIYFVAWTAILAPLLIWQALRNYKVALSFVFGLVFAGLISFTMVSGLLEGNSERFIMQEVVKYSFVPISFLIAATLSVRVKTLALIEFISLVCVAYYIIRLFLFLILGSAGRLYYGTPQELFAIASAIAVFVSHTDARVQVMQTAKIGILVSLTFLGQKRTMALSLVFVMLAMVADIFANFRVKNLSVVLFAGGLLVLGVTTLVLRSDIDLRRYEFQHIETSVGIDSLRVMEARLATAKLDEEPLRYLYGYGGGATLVFPAFLTGAGSGSAEVHSIHNTFVAMLYRHGLIGVAVYLLCAFYGVLWCLRNTQSPYYQNRVLAYTALTYKIITLLSSFVIFGLVDDFLIGIIAGLIYRQKKLNQIHDNNQRRRYEGNRSQRRFDSSPSAVGYTRIGGGK